MVNIVNKDQWILHLLLFTLFSVVHSRADYIRKVGKEQTFIPKANGKPESILWKFNDDKVVEFEDGKLVWFQFKNQGHLDLTTGTLTLTNLNKGNSGKYDAEIEVATNVQESRFFLQVIGEIGRPAIFCAIDPDGQITLQCSAPNSEGKVEYNWSGPDGKSQGNTLNVPKDTKPESIYFCTANNEVDTQSSQFALEECSVSVGVSVGIIVASVLIPLIVIVMLILAVVYRANIRNCFSGSSK